MKMTKRSKKVIVLFLAVALIVSLISAGGVIVSASGTIFSQDFSSVKADDPLPNGFEVQNGTVKSGDGYLELSAGSALLLPSDVTSEDFTYEVKFTIVSANEPSRWAGFMFRYMRSRQYMQMCCRQSADAAGGIDCAYNNSGRWEYPANAKGSYLQSIDPNKVYTAKIVVKGTDIALSLNGTICVISKTPLKCNGRFGVQSNGSVVRVYGVSVSEAEEVPSEIPDQSTDVKNVYEPETGIISAPTVIQTIDSDARLNALNAAGERTQVARFALADKNLNVRVGEKSYTLDEILAKCGTAVLPMFVTSDQETAAAFSDHVLLSNTLDVILASDNVEALKAAWAINKGGVRYAYLAGAVSETNTVAKISRDAHTACATIAVVEPNGQMNREAAEYLQLRALSVWMDSMQGTDEQGVYAAVDCGANGVTVDDFTTAYRLYEKVTKPTNIRKTFIVGHRGLPTAAPENSKEGYEEALKAGADAIECDTQITSDGVLVSNHNGSVDGYTTAGASGAISSFTWDQLSKFTLNPVGKYTTSQFCKMEWYFQILKDNPKAVGFVELKDYNDNVVKKTVELMESMGVQDQVVFICFGDSGLISAKKYAPYAATARLASGVYNSAASVNGNLFTIMKTIGLTASSPDYGSGDITRQLIEAGRHRGIIFQTWTVNALRDIRAQHRIGVDCVTTDYANYSNDDSLNAYRNVSAAGLFGPISEPSTSESEGSTAATAATTATVSAERSTTAANPQGTTSTGKADNVETGEESVLPYVLLTAAAALALAISRIRRKAGV